MIEDGVLKLGDRVPSLRQMSRRFPGQCFLGAAPVYDGRDTRCLVSRCHGYLDGF